MDILSLLYFHHTRRLSPFPYYYLYFLFISNINIMSPAKRDTRNFFQILNRHVKTEVTPALLLPSFQFTSNHIC
jgi:hypothetical protein